MMCALSYKVRSRSRLPYAPAPRNGYSAAMRRMSARRRIAALLTVLAAATSAAASSAAATAAVRTVTPAAAAAAASAPHLMAFGGRSAMQQRSGLGGKLDATLADLVRHASRVRAGHELEDLRALSPAARFLQTAADAVPLVAVDAVTRDDPRQLAAALVGLGLQHPAIYSQRRRRLAAGAARAAAGTARKWSLYGPRCAHARTGAVATQGDFAQAQRRAAQPTTRPSTAPASRSACSPTASTAMRLPPRPDKR